MIKMVDGGDLKDPQDHHLDLELLDPSNQSTNIPILVFVDDDGGKVTKCCSTSSKPVTVLMHEFGDSSEKTCRERADPSMAYRICNYFSQMSVRGFNVPDFLIRNSSSVSEILSRENELKLALGDDSKPCNCTRDFRCSILLRQSIVNIFFGFVLMALLLAFGSSISSALLLHMQSGVKNMILLLNWLMGVPAGLKLNYKLTGFLGRFFMYHIWLWSEYLRLAGQHFRYTFLTLVTLGLPGGASLQLAFIQDMFKVFFLHIYCFYIYCSRLLSVVQYLLKSLWRLFRGLKWNPLRERVDHGSYDSTQLFVGTLLLSILLFILPTVFLYYLVFATLRSIILLSHAVFDWLRYFFAHSYVVMYSPALHFVEKMCYKEDSGLIVQPSSQDNITVLTVRRRKRLACANQLQGVKS